MTASNRTTWAIALTGTFVLALAVADLAATKFALLPGGVVVPGGVFLFSVIFVVRDALHRVCGADYVRRTIWVAVALNVAMALYLWWTARLPAPDFFVLDDAWARIFTLAPGIVIGSIVAAVVSQLVNTAIYERLWNRGAPLWVRSIGSNLVSLPIDGILFTGLAFVLLPPLFGGEPIDIGSAAARVASGQTLVKFATVLVMTPALYLTPEMARTTEKAPV